MTQQNVEWKKKRFVQIEKCERVDIFCWKVNRQWNAVVLLMGLAHRENHHHHHRQTNGWDVVVDDVLLHFGDVQTGGPIVTELKCIFRNSLRGEQCKTKIILFYLCSIHTPAEYSMDFMFAESKWSKSEKYNARSMCTYTSDNRRKNCFFCWWFRLKKKTSVFYRFLAFFKK